MHHLKSKILTNFHKNFLLKRFQSTQTSTDYCLESLKKYDYENFICTLLLKNTSSRTAAIAIRGFNIEVARVAEQVSQPNIGLMRLKFWEETIDKCYSNDVTKIPQHPVAQELFRVINSTKLTKRYLKNLVNCRTEYINKTHFMDLDALEKYAEQSVSNVYYLLMEGSGVRNVHADHAASHLGKAQGILQQLRSIPVARSINFLAIPQDIMAKHKVSQEEVLRGKESEKLNECAFEVASRAHIHLVKARNLMKDVPPESRKVLLPAVVVENYLQRLQNVQHNVFHKSLQQRAWLWLPRLYFNSIKNVY